MILEFTHTNDTKISVIKGKIFFWGDVDGVSHLYSDAGCVVPVKETIEVITKIMKKEDDQNGAR